MTTNRTFPRAAALLSAMVLALALPGMVRAQGGAPEGNAHPQTQMVSAGALPNAFGEPDVASKPPTEVEKVEFAKAVDLSPLRTLAVFHDGRIKLMETLAKETVLGIAGRKSYRDYVKLLDAGGGYDEGKIEQFDYDPMFTLLDATIDLRYYADKALIGVGYLPLREAIIAAEFPGDEKTQERWKKLGRVTPFMLIRHGDAIERAHESEIPYRDAMARVRMSWDVLQRTSSNMVMVAPATTAEKWDHLGALPEEHPCVRRRSSWARRGGHAMRRP